MVNFRKLTLDDYTLLTNIFKTIKPTSSEFTFPYLYMWKTDYNLRYAMVDNYLCLVSNSRVSFPFAFCPLPINGKYDTTGFANAIKELTALFDREHNPLVFGRIDENKVTLFRDYYQDKIEVEYLEDASDYVYETDHLIRLAGRRYSSKRNHINQFKRSYGDYEYVTVGPENLEECRRILDEWCKKNETECVHPDNCERLACYELLDNWSRFPLKGALIKVNGIYEAFTIGELLNPDMAVIRVEKGNSDIHGIYTVINQEFCQREWHNQRFINREEDLGKEGLRKAKLSYYPAFMIKKYLIRV